MREPKAWCPGRRIAWPGQLQPGRRIAWPGQLQPGQKRQDFIARSVWQASLASRRHAHAGRLCGST
eukprot:351457-Chlamydomonas_euryale.AAC.9